MFWGMPNFVWGLAIGALFTLCGIYISHRSAQKRDSRAATQTIAQYRVEWIAEVRKKLSEYSAKTMTYITKFEVDPQQLREIVSIENEIQFLLNPEDCASILDTCQKMSAACRKVSSTDSEDEEQALIVEYGALRADIMLDGRDVLKAEWDRVKNEIRGRK